MTREKNPWANFSLTPGKKEAKLLKNVNFSNFLQILRFKI